MERTARRTTPVSLPALISSGLLVTIATAGALCGLGLRSGETLRIFRQGGRILVGGAVTDVAPVLSVFTGMGHHVLVATLWGTVLSVLTLQLRNFSRLVACVLLVPLYVYVVPRVVPPMLRVGYVVTSRDADLFPIAAAMSVALLCGAWVAKRD